jgi:WD40 repeat protein
MSGDTGLNPFPGPQPYRTEDSGRFLGREKSARKLMNRILAHPCVTLFGPSGAGKSSLMQAGIIPILEEQHDFRTVRVDAWRTGIKPLRRLVEELFVTLELGDPPAELSPREALAEALRLAERRSDRPLLIYLDQLEQLFLMGQPPEETNELLERLEALARMPVRGLQLVLSLREDYLGIFRDRARGLRFVLEQGFRLGPLTVREMAKVACDVAAASEPAQRWSEEDMRELMLQVRTPGQAETADAEVQAAFAQIVCRELWASGGTIGKDEAKSILHQYLNETLDSLGPLKADARKLLEEHLVAKDGSRTLLTERQAREQLPVGSAGKVLARLEAAAVLHAEYHQGSRYFELGHDWLAKKVLELKLERRQRARLRKLVVIATVAVGLAVLMGGLLLYALLQKERAFNQAMMAGAREMMERGQPAMATKLLLEARHPEKVDGWSALAQEALDSNFLELTLRGSGQPINGASFSSDGEHVITASSDGTARVWRAADGQLLLELKGHTGEVHSATFSQDGEHIVTASSDGTARLWRAQDGTQLGMLEKSGGTVRSAAFSQDGQHVVTTSSGKTARVWRTDGKGQPVVLMGHESPVISTAFSPEGERVVTTSWDETVRVWRATDGRQLLVLRGHEEPATSAVFNPRGDRIVTASRDGTARVWRADGEGEPVVLRGHEGPVTSAAFSPEGERIVTASRDRTVRVWRARDGRQLLVLKGHEGPVNSAAFNPEGDRIVTAAWDGTARLWRTERQGQPRVLEGHKGQVTSAAFSPGGDRIVTASSDKTARVWLTEGSEQFLELKGHENQVTSAAFNPSGERIVTTSWDGTTRVWRASTAEQLFVLEKHEEAILSAAFSPNGERIATGSWNGITRVWQTASRGSEPPVVLPGQGKPITSVAFNPEGDHIATASRDGIVRVWRTDGTGEPLELKGHEGAVASVTFSPDGENIATASWDGTARVWRADGTGEPLVLRGHEGPVASVAFSLEGDRVVTASWDGTARVWRAMPEDTRQILVLKGHKGPVQSARISGLRGENIVTASWDGTARVWPVLSRDVQPPPAIREQLLADNKDCLTPLLRQSYLDEKEPRALKHYETCEHARGRTPTQLWAFSSGSRTAGSPNSR